MSAIHEDLAAGRWNDLSLAEQLGNVGSEPPLTSIQNPVKAPNYRPVSMPMPTQAVATRSPNSLWRAGARAFFRDQRAARVGVLPLDASAGTEMLLRLMRSAPAAVATVCPLDGRRLPEASFFEAVRGKPRRGKSAPLRDGLSPLDVDAHRFSTQEGERRCPLRLIEESDPCNASTFDGTQPPPHPPSQLSH